MNFKVDIQQIIKTSLICLLGIKQGCLSRNIHSIKAESNRTRIPKKDMKIRKNMVWTKERTNTKALVIDMKDM
jgi:hypothetical protein